MTIQGTLIIDEGRLSSSAICRRSWQPAVQNKLNDLIGHNEICRTHQSLISNLYASSLIYINMTQPLSHIEIMQSQISPGTIHVGI